jgi:hypothetical protein
VVNNVATIALEHLGVHTLLYRVRWAMIAPVSIGVSVAMPILVVWLAAARGRFYCNQNLILLLNTLSQFS